MEKQNHRRKKEGAEITEDLVGLDGRDFDQIKKVEEIFAPNYGWRPLNLYGSFQKVKQSQVS